jgi:hypothetical protein
MTEELSLEEATTFTAHPNITTPVAPFGDILSATPSDATTAPPPKRKRSDPTTLAKGTRTVKTPIHSDTLRKFNDSTLHRRNLVSYRVFKNLVPTNMRTTEWYDIFLRLNSTAVATPTWNKYCSALNKLSLYCHATTQQYSWPLQDSLICGFTLWALQHEGLRANTVKSYIHGLSHLQKLHGFPGISITKSPTLPYLLTGAQHSSSPGNFLGKRQPVTFHRLLLIRRAILGSNWPRYNKIAMWTCALVAAFFGSFWLGELLCKHPNHFDTTSSLLGKHLTYCKKTNTWEIWIQSPKSNAAQGEKMVLFPIPNPKLCPVVFFTRFQK